MKKHGISKLIYIVSGITAAILIVVLLPDIFSIQAKVALGVIILMLFWWVTRPVHIAVTALLPLAVNSVFEMIPMNNMLGDYFNPIVLLIFGASVLTAAWTIQGLDKRIALKSLSGLGMNVNIQIILFFLISLVMSAFMPNMVVVTALCPIAYSMVEYSGAGTDSKTSFSLLLSIAWGAGLGGFATPMGGAMNLVAISALEEYSGSEFLYWRWVTNAVPYILILAAVTLIFMVLVKKDSKVIPGSRQFYREQLVSLGKTKRGEIYALVLFILAVVLAFARPLYSAILPGLTPPYIFLIIGLFAFFLRSGKGKALIGWKQASQMVNWGLIILFAGGIALGGLIVDTGAAGVMADLVAGSGNAALLPLIAMTVALGMFLANTSSNTAACAITIPLVVTICTGLAIDPILPVFITAAACNSAYTLPTSIRAVPVGYGLDISYMFRKGLAANLLAYVTLVISGYIAYVVFV